MKRLLVIILIAGIYLNRSYAYFYNFLSQNRLTAPPHETKITLGNYSGNRIIKYVGLGDSLTAGVGVSDYKNSYPYLLARELSLRNNVELINLASSGATSKDVLADQLPEVLSQNPDIITLLIGTNDLHNLKSVQEFRDNLTQIISQLKKGGARIYLLSIPYLGSPKTVFFPYNLLLDFRTKQFNSVINKVAADYEVTFIDLYAGKKPVGFYSIDQFHPSAEGYREWVKEINVN